jgi:hypothetical protein
MSCRKALLSIALCASMAPVIAVAQDQGGGRGNRGGGDATQMREQMMNRFKTQLGVSDEEWAVLQPKIEKVTKAQSEARIWGRGWGGRGGDNNNADQNQSALAKAASELRTALENKDTPPDEIVKKLTAVRDARTQAEAAVEAARKELKEIVTPRQEALLVTLSILE